MEVWDFHTWFQGVIGSVCEVVRGRKPRLHTESTTCSQRCVLGSTGQNEETRRGEVSRLIGWIVLHIRTFRRVVLEVGYGCRLRFLTLRRFGGEGDHYLKRFRTDPRKWMGVVLGGAAHTKLSMLSD